MNREDRHMQRSTRVDIPTQCFVADGHAALGGRA